jgi:hypothetical protein
MRGNMRRAERARPTDPQRDRFIIQPRNMLKVDYTNAPAGDAIHPNHMPTF